VIPNEVFMLSMMACLLSQRCSALLISMFVTVQAANAIAKQAGMIALLRITFSLLED
jgi:hypothetical protein